MKNPYKKKLKRVYQGIHKQLGLRLTESEGSGYFHKTTKIKLVTKTYQNLPMFLGHSVRGISFDNRGLDPFSSALVTSKDNFDAVYFSENLYQALLREKNKVIGDVNPFINRRHHDKPIWSNVLPWDDYSVENMFANYQNAVFENRNSQLDHEGFSKKVNDSLYTESFIESHVNQFQKLYRSIKTYGFYTTNDFPKVNILVDGDRWRWMMTGQGNHRFYILQLLGFTSFPCEINKLIYSNNMTKFSNVLNNDYSGNAAQKIFDILFLGKKMCRGII